MLAQHILQVLDDPVGSFLVIVVTGSYICANIPVLERPTRALRTHLHMWVRPSPRRSEIAVGIFSAILVTECVELGFGLARLL